MLAARVDACHESTDGHIGQMFREEIEKKLDKLQEPPPVKFVKPLPKPIDPGRKKRGGKRVRKMKERYAITEFRKHANRMNFADVRFTTFYFVVFALLIYLPICFLRLKMMPIKKILVIHVVQLVMQERVVLDYLKLMKKQKYGYRKRFKKIYKSNNNGVVVQQLRNRFLVQHPVLHLLHYR